MGGLTSTVSGHEPQEPAICAVDVLAEQGCGREELPAEVTDERGRTALHRAAQAGDETGVRQLLEGGASVSAVDRCGRTTLMTAASAGAVGLCALLVDAGADVDARDHLGKTALHLAVEGEGSAEVVDLLLRRGANPHLLEDCGRSALHCALQACNLEAAEVLVSAIGSLLQRDDNGRTELHWAAANGTPEIVWQLITQARGGGSDRDGEGMTPLARALQARNREAAGVLVVEACPCEQAAAADAFGRTVLHWAAYAGYPEVVRHLVRRGFSPWELDMCGKDALHWAVESGDRQVVEEILDCGGYRECVDKGGQTAVHVAAIRGDTEVLALLLDRFANPGRVDSEGRTPLMYALRGAHREAAVLIASRGPVSVLRRDRHKRTLLHWAAVGGDAEAVRQLLAHGAKLNALDSQWKSPAALAVEHGREEAAMVLVAAKGFRVTYDCDERTPLHGAAAAGWSRLALELVKRGADPNQGGKDFVSPVMLAMRAGHYSLARTISRAGWFSEKLQPYNS